ncbi:uncharacterized protein DUF488 [Nonlabens dokdonensis]|jgi:uncharacterized protein (DUF488 family)|uniref:Protein containing DUF1130 n=2 Tax=Nonlabens dokdonensis TaxID=328515 RepID=L7W837_NONDD|nr:DUF488 domain-containing protein [Nonlabens dokdonensis]AGC75971.1 protein containing DUF1130 [Nonlabens dokdonensis DSW-6]PZX43648.1 uncharacterized protein DUF488 [Nonlabens dokdonensis]
MHPEIFTIGYGNQRIEDIIFKLKRFGVTLLVDVRTTPFSRFNPNFRKVKLELHLMNNDIKYLFLGNELGGRPNDVSCYTDNVVDYDKVIRTEIFQEGINAVKELSTDFNIVLLCAELNPNSCHRKAMIGDYLELMGYRVKHILKDGTILNELF